MQPPVIFFIGRPRHGKTTLRQIAEQLTRLRGGSCSDVIEAFIADQRKCTVEEFRALPKEERRPLMVKVGDWLTGNVGQPEELPEAADFGYRIPSLLVRTLYHNGRNLIDGVRRRIELQEARERLEWNGVRHLTIWVDRPGEPAVDDNTELTAEDADEVITNDCSLEELKQRLVTVLDKYFPRTKAPPPPVVEVPVPTAEPAKEEPAS
jgi:hypothetical protein